MNRGPRKVEKAGVAIRYSLPFVGGVTEPFDHEIECRLLERIPIIVSTPVATRLLTRNIVPRPRSPNPSATRTPASCHTRESRHRGYSRLLPHHGRRSIGFCFAPRIELSSDPGVNLFSECEPGENERSD